MTANLEPPAPVIGGLSPVTPGRSAGSIAWIATNEWKAKEVANSCGEESDGSYRKGEKDVMHGWSPHQIWCSAHSGLREDQSRNAAKLEASAARGVDCLAVDPAGIV